MTINLEQEEEILKLRSYKYSYDQISAKTNISKPKVMLICKQNSEIIQQRQDYIISSNTELFNDSLALRMKIYLEVLENATKELFVRDLTVLSTDKILVFIDKIEKIILQLTGGQQFSKKDIKSFSNMSNEELESFINYKVTN